jgi:hypothetical protein
MSNPPKHDRNDLSPLEAAALSVERMFEAKGFKLKKTPLKKPSSLTVTFVAKRKKT